MQVFKIILSFQFHKGTIKTEDSEQRKRPPRKFQFHKGTIKTSAHCCVTSTTSTFQFHKGTIKTMNDGYTGLTPSPISIP